MYAVSLGKERYRVLRNFVRIRFSQDRLAKVNFTVCLGPLFGINNNNRLIEFLEMHKILGVGKVAIYDYSIRTNVLKDLNVYVETGFVDLLPWKLPFDYKYIRYYGQLGMLNECLYRYMFKTKYIAFIDMDEQIVPKREYTWTEMVNNLERNLTQPVRSITCGFSFQNYFFSTKWPNDEQSPSRNSLFYIKSLLKTKREPVAHGSRSKTMIKPQMVDIMNIHCVARGYNKSRLYNVDPSIASLHHYRYRLGSEWVIDRTMFKYSKDLMERLLHTTKSKRT